MRKIEAIKFNKYELQKLIKKLALETDIDFGYYRQNFVEKRIKSRMIRLNHNTAREYLAYINLNPVEVEKFKSGFTINTSYLFRNRETFDKLVYYIYKSLKDTNKLRHNGGPVKANWYNLINSSSYKSDRVKMESILPELSIYRKLKSQSESTFYIWSCACASGEEPYTLAILMNDFNRTVRKFPSYKIVASDIDAPVLQKAQRGIYIPEAMKEVPKLYELEHFTKIKDRFGPRYVINDEIKKQVEFIQEDVMKGHKKSYKYDVILCRYFLIYTDKASRDKILKILDDKLAYGGLLILGKTETLFSSYRDFKLIDSRNHIYLKTRAYVPRGC